MWNCGGALNPDFKRRIFEMAVDYRPSIMVITETRVGGDRAEGIIDGLPFDGFITTDTIGYAGGLWVLWNKEEVDISLLASTEQEIHAIVKFGGNQVNINRALEFKAVLDSCNFVNLGFVGPKYTWTNKRQLADLILERIDRCFANPLWRVLYPEAVVTHLPRIYSDHHPVLIKLCKPNPDRANRPFRFQSMWLLHPDFSRVVKEAWPEGRPLHLATEDFTRKKKKWNFEVFGNLFNRKRRVLARLSGTQNALANNPSESLIRLEKDLIDEYSSILLHEEEYWALKSRINAAAFGDRNTSYFHVSIVVRRQRNKIRCLKNSVGEWIVDVEDVKNHILLGFEKLYTTELSCSRWQSPILGFSCCFLSKEESAWIGRGVVEEEIKSGLWSLKPFKAPGADGLHAGFYQQFWHEVGKSVCEVVMNVFEHGVVPEFLNDTLITLIPKCPSPESLNNYRPISLCNSVYKIISKIIVNRIRPYIGKLVAPLQTAFVLGRKGIDNVLIAQELFFALDRKKGKEGYMAIKVDLEKAYDRLEWSFIYKVLQAFHFPQNIIKVIMSCVTSTKSSILFNGSALEPFTPTRGLRQGDLISPYLFILCMEFLGHLIEQKCVDGKWIPFKASRENVGISHLFFADDLILFAKVEEKACEAISEVLNRFCEESGQKVSREKSKIYFSPNVQEGVKEEICSNLGIQATNNIGKYLGFPINHRGAARNRLNFIAKRVMNKLAGWKAKFLSFAGRSVLVKSVMSAIPNYVMQGEALPRHFCEKLDKINWDFLWGSTREKRKLHLVGWNKIIRGRPRDPDKLPASSNWKAIKVGFQTFEKGIGWSLGDGRKIKAWFDCWIRDKSLRDLIKGPLTQHESDLLVSDLLLGQGQGWRWDTLSFDLPQDVKDKIRAIPQIQFGSREDSIIWKLSKDGDFSMKSAYALANNSYIPDTPFLGMWIWKLDILPKISHFLWMCMHKSVPVNNTLFSRGIIEVNKCPLCKKMPESIGHLLRECIYACDFWYKIKVPSMAISLFQATDDIIDWLRVNYLSTAIHHSSVPWRYVFPFAIWELWKHRNKVAFENTPLNLNLHRLCIS
ncbi:hypothetical protein SO802_004705 [Lithocarpus litseifolius]|uniref:Reverse transcriptase domain-containing protein n=1 Tax=Lithocarpus litseifolius TaxID=425828 RepID=A0AAW2E4S4_9ROSI